MIKKEKIAKINEALNMGWNIANASSWDWEKVMNNPNTDIKAIFKEDMIKILLFNNDSNYIKIVLTRPKGILVNEYYYRNYSGSDIVYRGVTIPSEGTIEIDWEIRNMLNAPHKKETGIPNIPLVIKHRTLYIVPNEVRRWVQRHDFISWTGKEFIF